MNFPCFIEGFRGTKNCLTGMNGDSSLKYCMYFLRRCLVRWRIFFVSMCFILEEDVGREISCTFCPVPRRPWRWLIKHKIKSFSGSCLKRSSFKLLVVYCLRQSKYYLYRISIYWPYDRTLHSRNKRKLPPSLMEKRSRGSMVSGTLILSGWSFAFVLFFTK